MVFGFTSRAACCIFTFDHATTQGFDFFFQGRRSIDGFSRGDEWARLEIRLFAVCAVKPYAKLASEFQRQKRIGMTARGFVCGPVARLPERVKNVGGFFRDDALIGQPTKRLLKRFPFTEIECVMGGNGLGQKLGKLTELKNRGPGIIAEVTLRQRPELRQLGVLSHQEREIACRWHYPPAATDWPFIVYQGRTRNLRLVVY